MGSNHEGASPIFEVFREVCDSHPHRTALVTSEGHYTYSDIMDLVRRIGAELDDVHPEDVVLLALPPSVEFVASYFALRAAGAAVAPLSGAAVDMIAANPRVRGTVLLSERGVERLRPRSAAPWREAGGSTVILTSGTTDAAKAVVHSDHSLLWGAWNTLSITDEMLVGPVSPPRSNSKLCAELIDRAQLDPLGLMFCPGLPLSSISGLTVMHRALLRGETLCALKRFHARDFLDVARRMHVNFALAPPMLRALLSQAKRALVEGDGQWQGRITGLGIGGGPVAPDMVTPDLGHDRRSVAAAGL